VIGRAAGGRLPGGRPAAARLLLVAGGASVALLLASCSSPGTAAHQGATTTTQAKHGKSPSPGTTTTTAPSPTTTTTQPASTAGAGLATCQPGQLHIVTGQSTGAAGTIAMTVSLTNTSSATCGLDGYPGMQLLDAQGGDITTTVVRGQAHFPWAGANQTPSLVALAPGGSATFALEYEDVPVGNETVCPTSARAEVTPPNDYTSAAVTLAIAPCDNGTVHVSPVYAP
jgi:hypothetical protein